jgi:hypothetical protein
VSDAKKFESPGTVEIVCVFKKWILKYFLLNSTKVNLISGIISSVSLQSVCQHLHPYRRTSGTRLHEEIKAKI